MEVYVAGLSHCSGSRAKPAEAATLQSNWMHQSQMTCIYAGFTCKPTRAVWRCCT